MNNDSAIPPSVPTPKTAAASELNCNRWQDQLLPVDTVLAEEDVTVLRQELETAHELLQYQQRLVDSLTEQLVGYEAHEAQLKKDLEIAACDTQREAEKLQESHLICQDLRSQLRRQQARICDLKHNSNNPIPHSKVSSRRLVSFGYASVCMDDQFAPSSSPVSPWSATDPVNFSDAFSICCRKLAALGLEYSPKPQGNNPQPLPSAIHQPADSIDQSLSQPTLPPLELPSFVQ